MLADLDREDVDDYDTEDLDEDEFDEDVDDDADVDEDDETAELDEYEDELDEYDDDDEPQDPVTRDRVLRALGVFEPAPTRVREWVDDEIRLAGRDVTPGRERLHHYWTRGEGLARWAGSPTPWRTLLANLQEEVKDKPLEVLKKWASRWFIEVFGFAAGSDLNRVTHGKPPRGKLVGPG